MIAMKGYSAFPKAPVLQTPHHQIVLRHNRTLVGVFLHLCGDVVGVFYSPNCLGHLVDGGPTSLQRCRQYILRPPLASRLCQRTGFGLTTLQRYKRSILQTFHRAKCATSLGVFSPLCRDADGVFCSPLPTSDWAIKLRVHTLNNFFLDFRFCIPRK